MNHFYSMNVCGPAKCTALCRYMQLWEDYAEIMNGTYLMVAQHSRE